MNVQSPNWKVEFLAHKEQEPPDSWDMEVSDSPASSKVGLQKPWKGAAGFIPKAMVNMKPGVETKQVALDVYFTLVGPSGICQLVG